MKKIIIGIISLLFFTAGYTQELNISAQIIPRLEVRDGFKTLGSENTDAAAFVSQRSRLNFTFQNKMEKVKFGLAIQNVRVWGDVNTLSKSDINGAAMHEAWAEILLDEKFSLKAGRQEIIYDDHRIFGSVDWAQQARSHDALIAKYRNGKHKLDVGLALNANGETLFDVPYAVNNYKAFQYLWYNVKANSDLGISILFLNNGLPYDKARGEQETAYSQTIGPRLVYTKDKLAAELTFYYQTGKVANRDLNAIYLGSSLKYKVNANLAAKLGLEYLSGTDMNETDNELKSFSPFYGTNHKFNGFMDYFFVGNHANSVGLTDIYASLNFKKDKFSLVLMPHVFLSPGVIVNKNAQEMDSNLGTEIDLTLSYKVSKSISIKSGYSKMFATETMEVLKGGSADEVNHWFWLSFVIKPQLFSYKKEN